MLLSSETDPPFNTSASSIALGGRKPMCDGVAHEDALPEMAL
jgi:hypothetical protein